MSNFPENLQTELTILMKSLDDEGLCVPANQVDQKTREASGALKAVDNALYDLIDKFKSWQEFHGFAPTKLAPILSAIGEAALDLHLVHVEAMKICHDKKIKVNEGGGK